MKTKNKSKTIEDYLNKYYRSTTGTKKSTRWCILKYFKIVNENPEGYFKKYDTKTLKDHLFKFIEAIENKPPRTQTNLLSSIKKYFDRNDIEIKPSVWEDLKIRNNLKRARSITKKATPTIQDLKTILSYSNLKQKTLFLFCATTGLRIGEAVKLTFNDIDMEKRKVDIRGETGKFDIQRYTFFTPEVKELLENWEKERLRLLQGKHIKSLYVRQMLEKQGYNIKMQPSHKEKNRDSKEVTRYKYVVFKDGKKLTKDELLKIDNRLFPFTDKNACAMWVSLLEKAGSPYNQRDENSKFKKPRYMYNQHCLRRFWYTQLSASRFNNEYMNFIGGHMSELDSSYIRFVDNSMWINKIKGEYDEHMDCLMVYENVPDLSGVHGELDDVRSENKNLQQQLNDLRMEMLEIKMKQVQELQRKEQNK